MAMCDPANYVDLRVSAIDAGYGDVQVLRGVGFEARAGEVLCLLGRNGAGKTTTLKTILGLVPASAGSVTLDGEDLTALPAHERPKRGIGYVPQGRRLFAELTVAENLEIGLMTRGRGAATRERMLEMFPVLRERYRQRSGTLSGGEQQMLAMARALCIEPRVLLLDEPTEGLQPSIVATIQQVIRDLKGGDTAVILVEQRVDSVRALADRIAFMETGRIPEIVAPDALTPARLRQYVGVG